MTRTELIAGFSYMAFQLVLLPYLLVRLNLILGFPLTDAQLNFVFFALDFICITVIFHRFLILSGKNALRRPFLCLRAAFLGLLLYWILSFGVNMLIVIISPDFFNVNDTSIMELTAQNYTLMAIGTVLLVPVVEETLYRGIIFRGLYNSNPASAYIVSALLFSALHVFSYIGMYPPVQLLLCALQYIPAGLCLGWAYVKADSIWAPILMHITINQIGILSMR